MVYSYSIAPSESFSGSCKVVPPGVGDCTAKHHHHNAYDWIEDLRNCTNHFPRTIIRRSVISLYVRQADEGVIDLGRAGAKCHELAKVTGYKLHQYREPLAKLSATST